MTKRDKSFKKTAFIALYVSFFKNKDIMCFINGCIFGTKNVSLHKNFQLYFFILKLLQLLLFFIYKNFTFQLTSNCY